MALERFASPQSPAELLTPAATTISHQYLTPKLGGDMAAIRGMAKYILEEEGGASISPSSSSTPRTLTTTWPR